MAVVLIGGLVTSTLLTLVLVPVMYTYLDQLGRLPALARDAGVPTLLVRKGLRPGGLAPPERMTRYTWSFAHAGDAVTPSGG